MLDLERKVLLGRSVGDNTDREQKHVCHSAPPCLPSRQACLPAGERATGEGIMVVRNKKTSTATTTLDTNDLNLTK